MKGEDKAIPSAPDDAAYGNGSNDRVVPELLTRIDVAEVNLEDRQADAGQGIAQGNAVVGERARVDDDRVGPLAVLLDRIDEDALVVALQDPGFDSEVLRFQADHLVDLFQRFLPVEIGLAESGQIEVRPIEDEDLEFSVRHVRLGGSGFRRGDEGFLGGWGKPLDIDRRSSALHPAGEAGGPGNRDMPAAQADQGRDWPTSS